MRNYCFAPSMNHDPFPKPQPADPLPLKAWLKLTDRAEVGREPFFRGRDSEYKVFRDAVSSLEEGHIGGGTMIFKGAPGAGKTALMAECMEAVRLHSTPGDPWVAVDINPENLESSVEVVKLIVEAVNAEGQRLSETAPGSGAKKLEGILEIGRKMQQELSERGIGVAAISIGGKPKHDEEMNVYPQRVFQGAAELLKNYRIVVFVDEAPTIPVSNKTKGVVRCLSKPPARIPLVAAFFGLIDTEKVVDDCGLSRPRRGRVVALGTFSDEDTACAIQSIFDAYRFTGDAQAAWVNALAELSQGWPQHINSVSVAAGQIIHDNGGSITKNLLRQAMTLGQKLKEDFYARRLRACSQDPVLYRQLALAENEAPDEIFSLPALRELTAPMLADSTTFDDFLDNALHAGILMEIENPPKYYRIPIPSFGDYLRSLPER
ncbi:MAG: ATP-binding protein [Gammaproteobacteria bacterium]|nr:ATP-binding protein [Gammaproteobacteria bacterium]